MKHVLDDRSEVVRRLNCFLVMPLDHSVIGEGGILVVVAGRLQDLVSISPGAIDSTFNVEPLVEDVVLLASLPVCL